MTNYYFASMSFLGIVIWLDMPPGDETVYNVSRDGGMWGTTVTYRSLVPEPFLCHPSSRPRRL